ncbi:MAG TPA: hypothetical protein VFV50_04405 [Bdellovibrionales bacterium]|nr:hypothetical protein [Bdellovibrionales bacterium]
MSFQQRSYAGKIFRPKPEFHHSDSERLLVVATPWGNRAGTRRAVDTLSEFFASNLGDNEATSPFRKLPHLSAVGNNLRIGVLLANEYFFNSENKDEYKNGAEFFAAAYDQKEVVWLQVGHPHVFLKRQGRPILQLSASIDLSMELSLPGKALPPLPGELIGIDANPHIVINSFRPAPGDKLVLISRSWLPQELFALPDDEISVEGISRVLSQQGSEDLPYWLGVWDL